MDAKVGRIENLRACVGEPNRAASAMAIAVVLMVGHSAPSYAAGDPDHGAKVYHECMICHSLDKNGIGLSHRDVFGRRAGSVPDYSYSAALGLDHRLERDHARPLRSPIHRQAQSPRHQNDVLGGRCARSRRRDRISQGKGDKWSVKCSARCKMTQPLPLLICHPFATVRGEFRVKNYAFKYPIVPSRVLIRTVKLPNGRFC